MELKVTALEDMKANTRVSMLFNDTNQIHCRKSLPDESPDAVTARVVFKSDVLIFDTGRDTSDLLRPKSACTVEGDKQ